MKREWDQRPIGATAQSRPQELTVRCEYKGRHFSVTHKYSGELLEGAALKQALVSLEESLGRMMVVQSSLDLMTKGHYKQAASKPQQETPEKEGQSLADQRRKERNRKRKERRKNLKAKMRQQAAPTVEPRPDATDSENPGTDTASHGNGVRRKGSDTAPPPATSPPTVPQRYVGEQYRENGDGQTVPVASNITTAPNSSLMDSTSMDCVD